MHPYPHFHKLMLISDRKEAPIPQYLRFVKICLENGVTSIQLREKNSSFSFQVEFGLALKKLCHSYGVSLIVNDDPKLAVEIDADGIHLGQEDGDPQEAFQLLGENKIIGLSIEDISQVELANNMPFITYVTASAVFPTSSKVKEDQKFWGLDGVKELALHSTHTLTAIGGISIDNAESVMNAGAKGLAVIGILHHAEDPADTTRRLRQIIQ